MLICIDPNMGLWGASSVNTVCDSQCVNSDTSQLISDSQNFTVMSEQFYCILIITIHNTHLPTDLHIYNVLISNV